MSKAEQRQALLPLIQLVTNHVTTLPALERADVFEGLGIITAGIHQQMSQDAYRAAEVIREAEQAQLTFVNLLRENLR